MDPLWIGQINQRISFFSLHCSVIKSFSVSNRAKEAFTNEMYFLHMERDDKGSSFCLMLMLNVP